MTRDVAALEAAVDDVRLSVVRGEHAGETLAQRRRTAGAVGCAEIQIRQPAFEQPGQLGLDAVAVEQHRVTVEAMQPHQLTSEGDVDGRQ